MNTKEKIKIMQAWDAGQPLQIKDYNDEWLDFPTDSEPTWNWDNCDYRIKPKLSKYRQIERLLVALRVVRNIPYQYADTNNITPEVVVRRWLADIMDQNDV